MRPTYPVRSRRNRTLAQQRGPTTRRTSTRRRGVGENRGGWNRGTGHCADDVVVAARVGRRDPLGLARQRPQLDGLRRAGRTPRSSGTPTIAPKGPLTFGSQFDFSPLSRLPSMPREDDGPSTGADPSPATDALPTATATEPLPLVPTNVAKILGGPVAAGAGPRRFVT